MEYFILNLRY